MKVIAALAGVVGLAFVVIMVIGDAGNPAMFGPIGHGGTERMIVYPVMLWMVAFGGSLFGAPTDVIRSSGGDEPLANPFRNSPGRNASYTAAEPTRSGPPVWDGHGWTAHPSDGR